MLTEIGAARIVPWAAERCVAVWRGERAEKGLGRWRATAREAAKQARRAWFTEVAPLASTEDVVALVAQSAGSGGLVVVLHEAAQTPMSGLDVPASGEVMLVVGPEGGISDAELARLQAAGAHVACLGAEVLRTSTAGLAAAAALLARTPRWGG